MGMLGGGLFLFGILVGLVGLGGFFDTRKVDRRFKTGYRNNEPDTRNFRRSAKRFLYGVGVSVVGAGIVGLSSPSQESASPSSAVDVIASGPTVAGEASPASSDVVQLDPEPTPEKKADSEVVPGSNERVVMPEDAQTTGTSRQTVASTQPGNTALHVDSSTFECVNDGSFFRANICKGGTLAVAYDLELAEYMAAQARVGGNDVGVRIEQEKWLEQVVNGCSDMTCLTNAFDARVADLRSRYRKDS